ncbi:MAG: hypothetical protein ACREMA_00910 [Longimicrobiales bacterium]
MTGSQSLHSRSRLVHFRIRDIHHPDPNTILSELHGNDLLQGNVVGFSDDGGGESGYVVVEVSGVRDRLIVSIERILSAL